MAVTVYLDSLFLLNLIINYLLLLVTAGVTGEPFHRLRLGGGAVLGAVFAVLDFLPGLGWLTHPLCKLGEGVLMVVLAYGGSRRLWKVGLVFAALSCGLGGGVVLIGLLTGQGLTVQNGVLSTSMDVKAVLLSAAACYLVLTLLFRRCGRHGSRELEPVVVDIGGERVLLTALHDTGNTLTDPATGRPVLVAEGERLSSLLPRELLTGLADPIGVMERFGGRELGRRLRLLPYRTVGSDCGFLLAIRADRVWVGKREYGGLLVALSPTAVSDGGGYAALFGE
jgi:stage II sporulation protein GA (sporulation sigma-E factor processing peptidase)